MTFSRKWPSLILRAIAVKYRILIFFCSLSLLLISAWVFAFHLSPVLLFYHLAVAVPLHIADLSLLALAYGPSQASLADTSRPASKPKAWFLLFAIGSWALLVCFFYLLIFGSVHFWGDIITIRILGTYFRGFSGFLRSMPFSYHQLWVAILLFIALPYIIALILLRNIERALGDFREEILNHRKLLLLASLIALLAAPLLMKAKRIIHKGGEPLMVMLFDHMWGVTDNPLFSQRRVRVGFEDRKVRREYAKANPQVSSRKNVILIIVDAMRADHLSAYGYTRKTTPFIDRLLDSGRAVKVKRCYSTCACTLCGVTSILLSRTWNDCAVNGFNIVGLLRDQGYQTHALISGAHKEWYNMAKFYSDDCQYYDGKDSRKYYFKDDRVLLEGLDGIHAYTGTPAFFYFHLQSTHETGTLLDKYTVYKPFKKSITTQGMNGQAAINEYDDKVLQADDIIRQILEALDQKGYLKNAMVVITADHGQGLGEHGVSGHVDWLYDPQVSVPLIICDDSIGAYRNLTFARHIDIAPTIADRLALPKPACWMGMSLMQEGVIEYSYHETGKNGLETGQAKYMIVGFHADEGQGSSYYYKYIFTADFGKEELYDLIGDPGETCNLAKSRKDILARMHAKAVLEMDRMYGDK